jgi:DNA invertase Pin-like site-specific DNA recombinase
VEKRLVTAQARKALKRAIKKHGSQAELARALGFHRQNVNRMLKSGHIPAKHLRLLEQVSGEPREQFRADLYER